VNLIEAGAAGLDGAVNLNGDLDKREAKETSPIGAAGRCHGGNSRN